MRPTKKPDFATDPLYTSGSDTGTPPRVDPGDAANAQGIIPKTEVAAQVMNNKLGVHGDWLNWLRAQSWLNFQPRQNQLAGLTAVRGFSAAYLSSGSFRTYGFLCRSGGDDQLYFSSDGFEYTAIFDYGGPGTSTHAYGTNENSFLFWSKLFQKWYSGTFGNTNTILSEVLPGSFTVNSLSLADGLTRDGLCFAENKLWMVLGFTSGDFIYTGIGAGRASAGHASDWIVATNPASDKKIHSIATKPSTSIFTGSFVALNDQGHKIFNSGGSGGPISGSWSDRGAGILGTGVGCVVWDGDRFVVANGAGKVETSVDGGITWVAQPTAVDQSGTTLNLRQLISVPTVAGSILYGVVSGQDKICQSLDHGTSWTSQNVPTGVAQQINYADGRLILSGAMSGNPAFFVGQKTDIDGRLTDPY